MEKNAKGAAKDMDQNVKAARMATLSRVAKALTENRMEAQVVESREELLEILKGLLPKGAAVASGGSMTLAETGVNDLLKSGDYDFYFRGRTDEAGQPIDVLRAAFTCDWYFSSSNAITEDGALYNVDGNANRVAALCFGPKKVVIIAGYNKVVRNLHAAAERVRSIAAPANCLRLGKKSPCTVTGHCMDCKGPDRICCDTVIHRFQREPDRIKVFLLPEDYGY